MGESTQVKENLKKTTQWLLEHRAFLESLLFEAISLSRLLAHLEYDDEYVSGLDAKFYVDFLSPITEDDGFVLDIVSLEFNITRHGAIILQYETTLLKSEVESIIEKSEVESVIERVALLDWEDMSHMEGPSYDDLESIRWAIIDRLMTVAEGKEISNYGILNASDEDKLRFVTEVRERYHDFCTVDIQGEKVNG